MYKRMVIAFLIVVPCGAPAGILHVDVNGSAQFSTIQSAIDAAADGDVVRVADGVYTGDGNRDIDFKGKAIAVRSENGPDHCTIDCQCGQEGMHRGFDLHSGETRAAIIEGFTITGGRQSMGAGIMCSDKASPTIRNNIISDNYVPFDDDGGGGIACRDGAAPLIVGNVIRDNYCEPGGGGGGIRCYEAGEVVISDNVFQGNSASSGGGLCIDFCSPVVSRCAFIDNLAFCMGGGALIDRDVTMTDCTFIGNRSDYGGGLYLYYCNPTLLRCRFAGNSARLLGGAVFSTDGCVTTLNGCLLTGNVAGEKGGAVYYHSYDGTYRPACLNCTFCGNRSPLGNALACQTNLFTGLESVRVANSILRDGGAEIWTDRPSAVSVVYSSVQGLWPGHGNVDTDPLFIDPGHWDSNGTPDDANDDTWVDGDYHLKSQAGRRDAVQGQWVQDEVTSPCIDAGDPMSAIMYEPFPNGGMINMGAYGGTAEASKTWFGGPVCVEILVGDLNGDCVVNLGDLALMAAHWLQSGDHN